MSRLRPFHVLKVYFCNTKFNCAYNLVNLRPHIFSENVNEISCFLCIFYITKFYWLNWVIVVSRDLNFLSNLTSSMSSFQWVLQILFKKIYGWSENLQKISVTLFRISSGGLSHFLFCGIMFKHYSKITYTVFPSFCVTTLSASFTNLTVHLRHIIAPVT